MNIKNRNKQVQTFPRSPCPITASLDLLGDKWTLVVIRDLFLGKKIFSEFEASPENIPTNILSERLKRLVTNDIITKEAYQERPIRYQYILTKKGEALSPIVGAIADWGLKFIKGTDDKLRKK